MLQLNPKLSMVNKEMIFVPQEFLKKEFSAENIFFWTACERYKNVVNGTDKATEAQRIYQQHLSIGAPEAVNVDAHGRQCTEQGLQVEYVYVYAEE